MTSRLRYKTQQQADREVRRAQSGFLTGQNLDLPRSEINETQVCLLDNALPYRTHLEGRAGTEHIADLPGGGQVHNLYFHQVDSLYILHRADRAYISSDLVTWNESSNVTDLVDARSTMRAYGKNLVIFQEDKITLLELVNSDGDLVLRRLNASNPIGSLNVVNTDNPSSSGPYTYNFVYTYYREVDGVLVAESGVSLENLGSQSPAVTTVNCDSPIEENTVVVQGFSAPTDADSEQNTVGAGVGSMVVGTDFVVSISDGSPTYTTQWTGIKIYRTANYGEGGIGAPYVFNLVGTYTFDQAESWQVGIGSMSISGTFIVGATNNNISTSDSLWVNNEILSGYGYTPIPNGSVGEVTTGYIFAASEGDSIYYYSEVAAAPELAGYFFAGSQFQQVDDGVTALFRSPDALTILCNTSTYRVSTLNSEISSNDVSGWSTLYPATLVDEHVGVKNTGTVSFMDQSRFIAVCSDYTVRVWDGANWGYDRAKQTVASEIKKATNDAVGVYHPDGFYLLWYSDDISATGLTQTLRLGLEEDVGIGWSSYSGSAWTMPPKFAGATRGIDADTNLMMLVAIDEATSSINQIETFNGPTGSRFVRRTVDSYGSLNVDFGWTADFAEMIGSSESLWVLHSNTNFYVRPFERSGSYQSDLELTVRGYADDNAVEVASFFTEDLDSDISFDKNILGKRIRLRLESNKSEFKLVGLETVFRVQDRPTRSKDNKVADYQLELASDLAFWATRTNPLDNIMKLPSDADRTGIPTANVDYVPDQLNSSEYAIELNGSTPGIGDLIIETDFTVR